MRRAARTLARAAARTLTPAADSSRTALCAGARALSNLPESTVYGGPSPSVKRVTLRTVAAKYERGDIITMVTAYDYPSAVHVRPSRAQPPAAATHLLTRDSPTALCRLTRRA